MIRKTLNAALAGLAAACLTTAAWAQPAFDPKPWLEDLQQARDAISANYANLEWAVTDRGVDLTNDYPRLQAALGGAKSEAEARRLFERFLSSFGDGHLRVEWPAAPAPAAVTPTPAPTAAAPQPRSLCDELGFSDWGEDRSAVARRLPGYTPLPGSPDSKFFPAGLIRRDGRTIGVLRIPLFMVQASPELCQAALVDLQLPADAPCDAFCTNRVMARAEGRYSDALARQLRALKAAGADVLLLDIAGNGGGSEWVGAAARMISPKPLRAQSMGLVRHPDFAKRLAEQAKELRTAAAASSGEEGAMLERYAAQADAAARDAARPCDRSALWTGGAVACRGVVTEGLYVGGWSAAPLDDRYHDRPWAQEVYRTAGYNVPAALWRGPLIVLVDGNTASASEQFTAQLQAAKAAVIVGSPTHGSGCGYITGSHGKAGSETVLKNSGGRLFMPNCARFLPNGANEVGGLEPDILLPFRRNDTPHQKARRLEAAMPRVLAEAQRLAR